MMLELLDLVGKEVRVVVFGRGHKYSASVYGKLYKTEGDNDFGVDCSGVWSWAFFDANDVRRIEDKSEDNLGFHSSIYLE